MRAFTIGLPPPILSASGMGKSAYSGARVGFLTKHEKEKVVGPLLSEALGAEVELVSGFDTDSLGTFTREIPRAGSQLDAARKKANLALASSGLELGLGSEGSFVPGPFGFGTYDLEVLVLVDRARSIEIVGYARDAGRHHHGFARTKEDLRRIAEAAGFPEHGLVLRADDENGLPIAKGIRSFESLDEAFNEGVRVSNLRQVFVENDLRAHQNPTRMEVIASAAKDLVTRALTLCDRCGSPGFGARAAIPGLPCGECQRPTRVPVADEYACVACEHRVARPREGSSFADPSRCDTCNP